MRPNRKIISAVTIIVLVISMFISFVTINGAEMSSDNYNIWPDDINSGGTDYQLSDNYKVSDTIGGMSTGSTSSSNYGLKAGYRQMDETYLAVSSPSNVNMSPDIPGITGGISTGDAIWTVTTDSPAGYSMNIRASTSPAMQGQNHGDKFADYTEQISGVPDYNWSIADSTAEFGYSIEGNDVVQLFQDNGLDSCNVGSNNTIDKCWYCFSITNQIIASSSSGNHPSGTGTTVKMKAQLYNQDGIPNNEEGMLIEDSYQATITVTVIAN
jgi:hypothetical protein